MHSISALINVKYNQNREILSVPIAARSLHFFDHFQFISRNLSRHNGKRWLRSMWRWFPSSYRDKHTHAHKHIPIGHRRTQATILPIEQVPGETCTKSTPALDRLHSLLSLHPLPPSTPSPAGSFLSISSGMGQWSGTATHSIAQHSYRRCACHRCLTEVIFLAGSIVHGVGGMTIGRMLQTCC